MKKLIVGLLLVFCFVSVALANEPAEVNILRKASGENWKDFREGIKKLITVDSDGREIFPTEILGRLAFKFATENGHLKLVSNQFRNESGYMNVFNLYNKLGETITVDDFLKIGQGEGFRLPIERDPGTKKFVPFDSDPIPVASVAETNQFASKSEMIPVEVDEVDPINASLQASQAEINSLKANLKRLSVNNTDVTQLKGKIGQIETQLAKIVSNLNGLSTGQKNLSNNQSKIAKSMQSELGAIQATMVEINTVKAGMESKFTELSSEDDRIGDFINEMNDYYFVITTSIFVLVVIILLYLGWERRRVSKLKSEVKDISIDVDGIKLKLTNLEFDQSAVSNTALKSMDLNIENQFLVKNVSSGVNYVVGIIRESEFMFLISGIKRRPNDSGVQKIDIRKTNLRNMIINAGEPLRFCNVSPDIVVSQAKAA